MKKKEILFEASLTAASGLAGISIPQENFVCSHTAHCSSSHQDAGMIFEKIYSGLHFSQDLSKRDQEILDTLVSLEEKRSRSVYLNGDMESSVFLPYFEDESWHGNFIQIKRGIFKKRVKKDGYGYKKSYKMWTQHRYQEIEDVVCMYSDTTLFISIGINKFYKYIFFFPKDRALENFFSSFAHEIQCAARSDSAYPSESGSSATADEFDVPSSSATAEVPSTSFSQIFEEYLVKYLLSFLSTGGKDE
eukprot:GHVP01035231.1.p1 GENE.GHVP01035231.1~~GHVP01035231.1.p1  ORF type:complete len:262 (-),score=41.20 GHVP01035231.1:90-833(-)